MKVNKNNEGIVFHSLDKRMAACNILLNNISEKISKKMLIDVYTGETIIIKPIPEDKNKCPNLDKCMFCDCWEQF